MVCDAWSKLQRVQDFSKSVLFVIVVYRQVEEELKERKKSLQNNESYIPFFLSSTHPDPDEQTR